MAGLASAQEQADDVDASEPGALKHATAVIACLGAARAALADELARL